MSGSIRLPHDEEESDQGAGEPGFASVLQARARRVVANTPAELVMRALVVVVSLVVGVLFGLAWGESRSRNGLGMSYLSPWPAFFISLSHLIFQPLLSNLLDQDIGVTAAGREFRDRVGFVVFWADLFAAVFVFVGSVVGLSYVGYPPYHTQPKCIAGGVLGFFVSFLILAINTGLIRHASRIRIKFSLAEVQQHRWEENGEEQESHTLSED